jgi:hypothetical protein
MKTTTLCIEHKAKEEDKGGMGTAAGEEERKKEEDSQKTGTARDYILRRGCLGNGQGAGKKLFNSIAGFGVHCMGPAELRHSHVAPMTIDRREAGPSSAPHGELLSLHRSWRYIVFLELSAGVPSWRRDP